jgi:hypothetical protein
VIARAAFGNPPNELWKRRHRDIRLEDSVSLNANTTVNIDAIWG